MHEGFPTDPSCPPDKCILSSMHEVFTQQVPDSFIHSPFFHVNDRRLLASAPEDFYALLGLDGATNPTPEEVKAAYRKLQLVRTEADPGPPELVVVIAFLSAIHVLHIN